MKNNIEEDREHRLRSLIKELKTDTLIPFRITAESRIGLANDIENILTDREKLEKENLELKTEIAEQVYFGSMPLDKMKELQTKANKYDVLTENVKNEIKELEVPILIYGGRGNGRTYARAEKEAKKYILKHILKLLEEEEV